MKYPDTSEDGFQSKQEKSKMEQKNQKESSLKQNSKMKKVILKVKYGNYLMNREALAEVVKMKKRRRRGGGGERVGELM